MLPCALKQLTTLGLVGLKKLHLNTLQEYLRKQLAY